MDEYKELIDKLMIRRDELQEKLRKVEKSLRETHDKDSEEQAVERSHEEVVEVLEGSIRLELEQIYEAFSRIEKDTYGLCVVCEKPISVKRLEALPYTDRCIDCAQG
ncbi:MAG TPA: TraR/DksA C4-type zinc finger protein [Thermodesulfobacteriota bacterium]|jgi:RNA polymerase-binding transcription factor DksA